MRIRLISCVLWIVLFASISCFTQAEASGDVPETVFAFTGAQFYSRTLESEADEETVHQLVFPVFVTAMITENLNIRLHQTVSTAKLDEGSDLTGLENTRVRGSFGLFENRFITYLGLSLPIAGVTPDEETAYLSELLYSEPLQFGVSRLTEGFGLDAGVVCAQPFGKLSLSLGAGYVLRGSYDRFAESGDTVSYDPGNALNATAGFHFYSGVTSLSGGVLYVCYGDDTTSGDTFENGNELSFSVATAFCPDPFAFRLSCADTIKGKSDADGIEITNLFTNRLNGGISLAYSLLNDTLILKTQADVKWLTDDGETSAKAASFGGGIQLIITDNVVLDISASLMSGDMDYGETEISGFNLGSIIRLGF